MGGRTENVEKGKKVVCCGGWEREISEEKNRRGR